LYRVQSRATNNISREIFQAYKSEQIEIILGKRLEKLNLKYFGPVNINYIARKTSSTVNDLRAALQICQTTLQIYRERLQAPSLTEITQGERRDVFRIVTEACDRYKGTPFVSVIGQLCELFKAILIVFCKHRRIVCGGDDHSVAAGLTAIMAWEKFQDFMDKVKTDAFFNSNKVKDTNTYSESSTASKKNVKLRVPPYSIFQEALQQLHHQRLFSTTSSTRPCGRVTVIYHLNSALLYSDLLAALKDDVWDRYLLA
jgi:hypothetical protein